MFQLYYIKYTPTNLCPVFYIKFYTFFFVGILFVLYQVFVKNRFSFDISFVFFLELFYSGVYLAPRFSGWEAVESKTMRARSSYKTPFLGCR